MPLPNDNKSEPAALEHCPDALDDYFLKHLETCESCRSITTDASCEPGAASRRILSQSALVELLHEPAFQEAVTHLQNLSFADAANPAHASPTVEMGSQIGSYRLLEPIACGGMGEVYRAVHVELGKVVAVKLLSPHRAGNRIAVDRFRREMQVQGRFSHPHVVGATDGGEDDGRFYLVMEYVEGLDLSELVNRLGPLRVADAAELIRQAALGVEAIHRQGLVHRDVKPSNIMLSREGVVKILDLGLSRFAAAQEGADGLTEAGQILGTKRFMAPEQFETSQVDSRADLYSLGASLSSLLSGEPPILPETTGLSGETTTPVKSPASHPLAPRDDVPEELADIVRRFTARAPSDRPGTAGELVAALQPLCTGSDLKKLLSRAMDANNESATSGELRGDRTPPSTTQRSRSIRRSTGALLLATLATGGIWTAVAAFNDKAVPDSSHTGPLAKSVAKDPQPRKSMLQTPIERLQERDVAVWVLMKGGEVNWHPHTRIRRLEEIPDDGPFRVRKISLVNRGLADVDLLPFQRLSMLDTLQLSENSLLTNRGLTELARIKTLKWLYVGGSRITDAALSKLNNLSDLESLGLGDTAITDNGLATIVKLNGLRELQLNKTRVTDAGLKHLKNFPNLVRLDLSSTGITDAGLESLVVSARRIKFLKLKLTKITDNGITHLKKMRHLKELNLEQTAVTPKGVEALRGALTGCKIKF